MRMKNARSQFGRNRLAVNSMESALLIVLGAMVLVFSLINPLFVSVGNIKSILTMAAGTGIMAVGLSFVILSGNFDFSIGSILGITVVLVAKLINLEIAGSQLPLPVSLLAGIMIGVGIGLINGYLVSYVGINSIIVTLGTLSIFRGITYWVIIDNIPVHHGLFVGIGRYFIGDVIPANFILWIGILILMYFFMRKTRAGRNMYLVGANKTAAEFSGVDSRKTQMLSFVISGCAASLGGIIKLSQIGFSDSTFGIGYEFHILVICVLGGISLMGGRGNLLGVFISTLIIGSISNGLVLADVEVNWREAFIGIILIGALLMDVLVTKRREIKRIKESRIAPAT